MLPRFMVPLLQLTLTWRELQVLEQKRLIVAYQHIQGLAMGVYIDWLLALGDPGRHIRRLKLLGPAKQLRIVLKPAYQTSSWDVLKPRIVPN